MSITKILADKNLEAEDKIAKVGEIVAKARKAYGNSDTEIKDVNVNTAFGVLPFSGLEDDSKVEILRDEALKMKAAATQAVANTPGVVFGKKVEELLAVNPYFANATKGAKDSYL